MLPAPQNVRAIGFDRHIEVRWNSVDRPALRCYMIYRALDGKDFQPIGIQLPGTQRYSDFLGKASNAAGASTREVTDDELLTMLQEACFHYLLLGCF
jgi:hypothetical protein